ncbi:MAG: type II toxin-antitoxin system RelE/ParE family toxin [Rhodomicrobium sp.]
MPSYKLSEEAALDVEFIIDDGLREFGINQALKYHLGLESRFELLAQFPRIGLPTYDVRPGLYRYPLRWPRLFGQNFRFDKWNVCRG